MKRYPPDSEQTRAYLRSEADDETRQFGTDLTQRLMAMPANERPRAIATLIQASKADADLAEQLIGFFRGGRFVRDLELAAGLIARPERATSTPVRARQSDPASREQLAHLRTRFSRP